MGMHDVVEGATDAGARGAGRPVRSGVPKPVWLVTWLWGALLLGASLVWPMTYGYDELAHVEMVTVYQQEPFTFYGPGELLQTEPAQAIAQSQPRYLPTERLATTAVIPRDLRLTFDDLGGATQVAGSAPDQMVQHPPLYYWLEGGVLGIPGVSGLNWDVQVWLMRLLSVVLVLPVPMLCWSAASRLAARVGPRTRLRDSAVGLVPAVGVLAAVIPLTVSSMVRAGASVNNDALLILTTSVVLERLVAVTLGDLRRRTALVLAVALAAALWSKGFALALVPLVLLGYGVALWRHRRTVAHSWTDIGLVATGVAVGCSWWVRNLLLYGAVQPSGAGTGYQQVLYGAPDHTGTLLDFVPQFLGYVVSRLWGGIGLPDEPSLGPVVVYGWFALAALGVVACLVRARRARLASWLLLGSVAGTLAIAGFGSYETYSAWSAQVVGTSGRYLYPTVVAVAAMAALGWHLVLRPRVMRFLVPVVAVGAVATNAVTWLFVVRYWYGPDGEGWQQILDSVRVFLTWSPLPEWATVFVVVVVPVVTSAVVLWQLTSLAWRSSRGYGETVRPAAVPAETAGAH